MMKRKVNLLVAAAILGMVGFMVYGAVTYTQAKGTGRGYGGNGQGSAVVNPPYYGQTATAAALDGVPVSSATLTQAEKDALLYMREEEKLARDVYNAMFAQWGLPVFQNIAASEQTHMDSIKTLLDRYGLSDPASASAGVFTNPNLQALYNQLVEKGKASPADAVLVGGAIEEIDIQDLRTRLAVTVQPDIQQVFTNLLNGSINHLSAFASNYLTISGTAYTPQYLSLSDYQTLAPSAVQGVGSGQGYRGGRGNH